MFDSMAAVQADGVAMCDAHPDLEVFRLRLGKALNYEYNEDSQTGLFQRRDPREGGPALDIERGQQAFYITLPVLNYLPSDEQTREGRPSECSQAGKTSRPHNQQRSFLQKRRRRA